MFLIDFKNRKSISDQIVDNVKGLVVSGVLRTDEKMPSVRELAEEITVNPNTVQKAYRILEGQGYIYSSQGRGTFVSDRSQIRVSTEDILESRAIIKDGIDKLYYAGLSREETRRLIEDVIDEREEWT